MNDRVVIGFLSDIPSGSRMDHYARIAALAADEAREQGLCDVEVEFVSRECNGLPRGDGEAVVSAYKELVAAGAVAVIGPFVTDNAVYLKPTVEQLQVPTLSWCGAASWLGHYTFSLPNGSLQDEGPLLARYAHLRGYRRVAIICDDSEIGSTYLRFFAIAARRLGLDITTLQTVASTALDVTAELDAARATDPDALIYLGYGMSLLPMQPYFADWAVPRLATTAFVFCYRQEYLPAFEGWSGLDQLDPANPERRRFNALCRERLDWVPDFMSATLMYDSVRALVDAFSVGGSETPAQVRDGMEGVRLLPASSGGAGTTISFGPYSHKGWEGTRYLVMGHVKDGVPRFESYLDDVSLDSSGNPSRQLS